MNEQRYCAKEIAVGDDFEDNEIWVDFNPIDQIFITEMLPEEDCRIIRFRAGNIRAVIAALEEMADWLEESPEESERRRS